MSFRIGPRMRLDSLGRILFVLYCIEAGAILLLLPWGGGWERLILHVPDSELQGYLLKPVVRGLLSAFGVVHLVWAAHDLDLMALAKRSRTSS
ncbi:MAG: hypothetical protein WBP10_13415 [Thermoanaerobaculia bacterium]